MAMPQRDHGLGHRAASGVLVQSHRHVERRLAFLHALHHRTARARDHLAGTRAMATAAQHQPVDAEGEPGLDQALLFLHRIAGMADQQLIARGGQRGFQAAMQLREHGVGERRNQQRDQSRVTAGEAAGLTIGHVTQLAGAFGYPLAHRGGHLLGLIERARHRDLGDAQSGGDIGQGDALEAGSFVWLRGHGHSSGCEGGQECPC